MSIAHCSYNTSLVKSLSGTVLNYCSSDRMMQAQDDQVAEAELEEESTDLAATRRAYIIASLVETAW